MGVPAKRLTKRNGGIIKKRGGKEEERKGTVWRREKDWREKENERRGRGGGRKMRSNIQR